jgi:alpha,alpha-trehalase
MLPPNLTTDALPAAPSGQSTYALVPPGQLGVSESQLPGQPVRVEAGQVRNATAVGPGADINASGGTVHNGGSVQDGEGWARALGRELANRYIVSAFCGWHATGGEIPGVVPRLSEAELNVTNSVNNTGNVGDLFYLPPSSASCGWTVALADRKYICLLWNIDVREIFQLGYRLCGARRGVYRTGGLFTHSHLVCDTRTIDWKIQAGFGWTNGVVLWIAKEYGQILARPVCPNVVESQQPQSASNDSISVSSTAHTAFRSWIVLVALGLILVA